MTQANSRITSVEGQANSDASQSASQQQPITALDRYFMISERGSNIRQEVLAGLTTFLAMVYSVIVVPSMLGKAGFPPGAVFVATCLVAGFGSLLMGLWAKLPMAIGCAISLTAFTAFSLVLGQQIPIPVALGAVFLMGVFTAISVTGVRSWILDNLPMGIAHGTGIGIGLFLLLIAANGVGLVIKNPLEGLPVALGAFTSMPVIMSLIGLAVIFGLEKLKVPGGILLVIIAISIFGLIFDPAVKYQGLFALPSLSDAQGQSLIFSLDIMGALSPLVLPSVLALVMTAVFDATGTIRAVAGRPICWIKMVTSSTVARRSVPTRSAASSPVWWGRPRLPSISNRQQARRRGQNRPDRNCGRRPVPVDAVPLAALLSGAGLCHRTGPDVCGAVDAEQRHQARFR